MAMVALLMVRALYLSDANHARRPLTRKEVCSHVTDRGTAIVFEIRDCVRARLRAVTPRVKSLLQDRSTSRLREGCLARDEAVGRHDASGAGGACVMRREQE